MKIKIKRLHPDARIPEYATDGSGCFDLYAAGASTYVPFDELGHYNTFDTGIAFEVPKDHVMLVFGRSGFGFSNNVTLCNAVGIIDEDYRGSVKVKYAEPIPAGAGDRIAQAMIIPVPKVSFGWADELTQTDRGENGFGSTGVK